MKQIVLIFSFLFLFINAQQMCAQKIVKDTISAEGIRMVEFQPSEKVCSKMIYVSIKDDLILDAHYKGGCSGNTQGISALIKGMTIDEAVTRIKGIECRSRGTSCPDQLAIALTEIKKSIEAQEAKEECGDL